MIIEPKARGFICTTAHPVGCKANVKQQIEYTKQHCQLKQEPKPKRVLVIGASTGYGLASRISAAFGAGAATIGVFFEKAAKGKRTASAGWYNSAAFEQYADEAGLYAKSINGDAFSDEIKQQVVDLIQKDWGGEVDLVVYSLASPRRTHPKTGEVYSSTLKTLGEPFTDKSINLASYEVETVTIEPASEEEALHTKMVMGGEDWKMWMDLLQQNNLLADGAMTVAYSYVGPVLTHAIYREGTIGGAKKDLEQAAKDIDQQLSTINGHAYISVNKALVTQAAAAIPVVPLYSSILYKTMKADNSHEGCIEQMNRLFHDRLYTKGDSPVATDDSGMVRMDDWEMKDNIQHSVQQAWNNVTTENLRDYADIDGYRHEFMRMFGFEIDGVDYQQDVDANVGIPSIKD
ncbi:MAG: trans-2-enoyl-CoA reductase family protein [Coxiellaceae bacterium]|nr:trans-2-enoyl-CoA reductase family protein [Coxiellaceae bacterium]